LESSGRTDQKRSIAARIEPARDWLLNAPAKDTEDRVFRLWGLTAARVPEDTVEPAAKVLRDTQRPDGGWSQLDGQPSDA
jgi:hypothetical protein